MRGFPAGDPRARAAGAVGGRSAGLKRKKALLKRFATGWNVPVDLLHAIYDYGQVRYRSGVQARRRQERAS